MNILLKIEFVGWTLMSARKPEINVKRVDLKVHPTGPPYGVMNEFF